MRLSRLIHVVSSFGIVLGAYWAYALCAVPLIEPTLDARRPNDASAFGAAQFTLPTQRFRESLAPFFPAGSWELEDAKILKTPQAILLLQDYRALKDGRLKIEPCTVVFQTASRVNLANNDSHAKGRALVMRAPDGAVLIDETLLTLNRVIQNVDQDLVPVVASTLTELDATAKTVREAVSPGSPLRYDLDSTLQELAAAARSIRLLAEYLERNPNALIYGKGGGPPQ